MSLGATPTTSDAPVEDDSGSSWESTKAGKNERPFPVFVDSHPTTVLEVRPSDPILSLYAQYMVKGPGAIKVAGVKEVVEQESTAVGTNRRTQEAVPFWAIARCLRGASTELGRVSDDAKPFWLYTVQEMGIRSEMALFCVGIGSRSPGHYFVRHDRDLKKIVGVMMKDEDFKRLMPHLEKNVGMVLGDKVFSCWGEKVLRIRNMSYVWSVVLTRTRPIIRRTRRGGPHVDRDGGKCIMINC